MTVRRERFESNFLTLPGKPNTHAWGPGHPRLFPFLSGLWIRVTPLTTKYDYSTPACYAHLNNSSKGVRDKSTHRANQVLKLADYHISRHVVSTFKQLTTTTTHCSLSIFSLNWRGLNHEQRTLTPPVDLIVTVCSGHSTPTISRGIGNHSTFTGPISRATTRT